MNKNREIFSELVLINLFILNLAIGSISNFSDSIFLLKGSVSFLLIVATIISFKLLSAGNTAISVNDDSKKILHPDLAGIQNDIKKDVLDVSFNGLRTGIRKVSVILCLFIGYLVITLTYSSNSVYGFQKILNFIISIVPSIFVFYYLIITLTELRIKLFIYSIVIISILTVSYILIVYPFDQSTVYEYRAGRWSHVIYGRMISSIAVVLFIYLISIIAKRKTRDEKRNIIILVFVTALAIYGTYLSAFRAGFVGLLVISVWLVVCGVWLKIKMKLTKNEEPASTYGRQVPAGRLRTKELTPVSLLLTPIPFLLAALLIFILPKPGIIDTRFENMLAIEDMNFKDDPAINSRLDTWELSCEIIKRHPIIGVGFGGFNGYDNIDWTKSIKYGHNIILEMAAEGGGVGLLVLGSLFLVMFRSVCRFSSPFFLPTFFIFALFLAMFSKDISSQSLLWIGLAFVGVRREGVNTRKTDYKIME